ncbi:unnamed protein product [Commensalibacter communis]|uniref:Uncharacterized protein n=1 Tax=Commensalibacter communis TaxID=2972786 RepID=A0A9W4XHZ0_9PROT|nr:hypothetical protein [Commensalibacter communis]CAI3943119.1 unnamed protein product [Commensalibacter communis]CAI3951441.1 unnamed protein product [Commensalibacter communis]CAI3953048.1 unnamed protein product [Commensalibacter communis]CAI3960299.1 unnamed protein product [Commensalibacter communis]
MAFLKRLTASEKKIITSDWKSVLKNYQNYKTLHLIKRNGPILIGVYLQPVYAGEHYVPVFHTHSLMTVAPTIGLSSLICLKGKKGANESISVLRHASEFEKLVSAFKKQVPLAFVRELYCQALDQYYQHFITIDKGYSIHVMTENILLLFWCQYDRQAIEQRINKYKSIIQQWPDAAKIRFSSEQGWEKSIHSLMSLDRLQETVQKELLKFKLDQIEDNGLIID